MLKTTLTSLLAIALLSLLTDMVIYSESGKKYLNFVLGAAILATLAVPLSTLFSELRLDYSPPAVAMPDSSAFANGIEQTMRNYTASAAQKNAEAYIREHYPGISFSIRSYLLSPARDQIVLYITLYGQSGADRAAEIKQALADHIGIKPANVNIYLSDKATP